MRRWRWRCAGVQRLVAIHSEHLPYLSKTGPVCGICVVVLELIAWLAIYQKRLVRRDGKLGRDSRLHPKIVKFVHVNMRPKVRTAVKVHCRVRLDGIRLVYCK